MSRTSIVDVTYDDPRTGDRVRERRVQEIPWDAVEDVRNRELALVRPRPSAPGRDDRDSQYADDRYALQRRRDTDDDVVPHQRREESSRRPQQRRDQRYYDDDSDSESSRERRRRRRRREERSERNEPRDRNAKPSRQEKVLKQEETDEGKLWYSLKNRRDGNFAERNFDSSYDGIIAAAAGAAIGAITVRNFAETEDDDAKTKLIKTLGGAVVGAAGFNAAENWYRVFTEEREEKKEKKEIAQESREVNGQGR